MAYNGSNDESQNECLQSSPKQLRVQSINEAMRKNIRSMHQEEQAVLGGKKILFM